MRQIRVTQYGGPEQMRLVELPDPIRSRPRARRWCASPSPASTTWTPPRVPCRCPAGGYPPSWAWRARAASRPSGTASRTSSRATGSPGSTTRAATPTSPRVRADSLVKIPEVVDDQTAAAVMMQGLTAHHLVTETYPVAAGDTAVVLAAAGGVGLLLTQMVKAAGGRAIGLVSREDKAPAAGAPTTSFSPPEAAFRTRSGSFPAGAAPTSSTAAAPTPSAPPSWRCAVTACTPSTGT
jgi:hypothetical protein